MGVLIIGSLIFCYGLLGINNNSGVVAMLIATVGLSVALRGVAEVTAHLMVKGLQNQNNQPQTNSSSIP